MLYKTIIELVCNAQDADEAMFTAGEYLMGRVDTGVEFKSRTIGLVKSRMATIASVTVVSLFVLSVLFFGSASSVGRSDGSGVRSMRLPSTCTMQPILKTSTPKALEKEWSEVMNK